MRRKTLQRKGANQYSRKYKGLRAKVWRDIVYIIVVVGIVCYFGFKLQHIKISFVSPISVVSAEAQVPSVTPTPQEVLVADSNPNPSQDEIEAYIHRIFGDQGDIAVAVSRAECPPANSTYPRCVLHSQVEHSVGVFQINLYNADQKIHADRVPGTTMQEKELWLKNPFNNTLYAYWVYSTSGWNPWSTYTSGKYLENMN